MLTAQIFMGGHISGAHYNPAVTIGIIFSGREKITIRRAIAYIIIQVLAGIVAAFFCWGLNYNVTILGYDSMGDPLYTPTIAPGGTWYQAFAAETVFTFSLVNIVLTVGTSSELMGNPYFGVAIGLAVASGGVAVGGEILILKNLSNECLLSLTNSDYYF
jgi:aquaporin Z